MQCSRTIVEFSLEVQKTGDGKWHIPAADGITWLCMGDVTRPSLFPNGSISHTSNVSNNHVHEIESSSSGKSSSSSSDGGGAVENRMAPRVLPSKYSAPSWKRKYFNALNPFIYDDILHPSDLSMETSTSNTTSTSIAHPVESSSSSSPLDSISISNSTLSSSSDPNSHSHSNLSSSANSSSSSQIESADNKSKSLNTPVDTVDNIP